MEAIAIRLQAIATRVEAIANSSKKLLGCPGSYRGSFGFA